MSLKCYDFRCTRCAHEFEGLSRYSDAIRTVEQVPCVKCGSPSSHFWKRGTRIAVRGDFSEADAAMASATFGTKVTSRAQAQRLARKFGLAETDEKTFDRHVIEAAHTEDPFPTEERELPREEAEREVALIQEQRKRIQIARDHGVLPTDRSLNDVPAEVRAVAGV